MLPSPGDYQVIIDQVRESMGYDFVSLAFAQSAAEGFEITWQYASGNLNNRYRRIVLQSGKGIAGIVFKTGKPIVVSHVREELNPQDMINYPILISERLLSLVAIPLYQLDRVEGVLLAGSRESGRMTMEEFQRLSAYLNGSFGDYLIKEMSIS